MNQILMRIDELKEFIVLDTETTGFKPQAGADAIEVSALKVVKDTEGRFKVAETFDIFINPGYPLPPAIVAFNEKNNTGVNDDFLADKPTPEEAAKAVFDFVGDNPVIIGHNINFDIGFIDKLYQTQLGIPFSPDKKVDTLAVCNKKINSKSHKLGDMFALTEKRNSADNPVFHNSLADCLATLDVLEYLADTFYPNYRQIKGEPEVPGKQADVKPADSVKSDFETFASGISDEEKHRRALEKDLFAKGMTHIRDIPLHMLNAEVKGIAVGCDYSGDFVKGTEKLILMNAENNLVSYAMQKLTSFKDLNFMFTAERQQENPDNILVSGIVCNKKNAVVHCTETLDLSNRHILSNEGLIECSSAMERILKSMTDLICKQEKKLKPQLGI